MLRGLVIISRSQFQFSQLPQSNRRVGVKNEHFFESFRASWSRLSSCGDHRRMQQILLFDLVLRDQVASRAPEQSLHFAASAGPT